MIKKFIFFCFLLLTACLMKEKYYDIEGPKFEFYTFYDDSIIFQFNEPVVYAKFILKNKSNQFENLFPVANIRVKKDFFNEKNNNLIIELKDNKDNTSKLDILPPIINQNPAEIEIEKLRIIYTKKREQMVRLKIKKTGSLYGYKLVFFIRGDKVKLSFNDDIVKKNDYLDIFFNISSSKINEVKGIDFQKSKLVLYLKSRLSQISSLIYIVDSEEKVLDYFLYYNTKKHPEEYYKSNKTYNNYLYELNSYNIDVENFDIIGSTSTKTINKINNKFMIKKD